MALQIVQGLSRVAIRKYSVIVAPTICAWPRERRTMAQLRVVSELVSGHLPGLRLRAGSGDGKAYVWSCKEQALKN
jgi:hypothetical protein